MRKTCVTPATIKSLAKIKRHGTVNILRDLITLVVSARAAIWFCITNKREKSKIRKRKLKLVLKMRSPQFLIKMNQKVFNQVKNLNLNYKIQQDKK